jgi:acyl-CoA thioesterase FadM
LTKLGESSARLEFRTLKNDEIAATGAIVIACMSRETQRAIRIPDDMRAKLAGALSSLDD